MRSGLQRWLAAVCGGLSLSAVQAQEEAGEIPDLDFLEYLGTWQESDEEWLAVSGWDGDVPPGERARDAETDEAGDEND